MEKRKTTWRMLAAAVVALVCVGLTACKDDDEDPDITGDWIGTPITPSMGDGFTCNFGADGTVTWASANGTQRKGRYTFTITGESPTDKSSREGIISLTWDTGATADVQVSGVTSTHMLWNYMYVMSRPGSSGNGSGSGDNNTSLVGKTFKKTETSVNNSGGAVIDNVQISFTSATACTMRCWGSEVFIYSNGDVDEDKYDTGTMTGTYTITGDQVHISCWSTVYSTTYNRDERIVNGSLVGFY